MYIFARLWDCILNQPMHAFIMTNPFRTKGLLDSNLQFHSNSKSTFCKQIVQNLIRRRVLWCLIWFYTVCHCPIKLTLCLYWFKSPFSSYLSSRATGLTPFGWCLYLCPYYVYACSEGSGETMWMHRLVLKIALLHRFNYFVECIFSLVYIKRLLVLYSIHV